MAPLGGSAAEKAGLLKDDILTHVDGVDIAGLEPDEIQKLILGDAGTKVTITVRRKNNSTSNIDVIRTPVKSNNVESRTFKLNQSKYGHISLKTFTNLKACHEIKTAILNMSKTERVSGLILDLRGNGGGDLAVAQCIAGL